MKALFKYSFMAGLSSRYIAFAVIFVMNLVFIVLGAFGLLPLAAQITAVSLSGTAIGVMSVFNIIGDISIIRSMFSAPAAVLYALTPAPRGKRLFASSVTMFVIDAVTMTVSIVSVIILALMLGSRYVELSVWEMVLQWELLVQGDLVGFPAFGSVLLSFALIVAAYILLMIAIMFCMVMRKSIFYSSRVGGLLTFLLAVGVFYVYSISPLLLIPFGDVSFWYGFITVTVGYLGMGMYALLTFIFAAVLFVLTARLFERKINI